MRQSAFWPICRFSYFVAVFPNAVISAALLCYQQFFCLAFSPTAISSAYLFSIAFFLFLSFLLPFYQGVKLSKNSYRAIVSQSRHRAGSAVFLLLSNVLRLHYTLQSASTFRLTGCTHRPYKILQKTRVLRWSIMEELICDLFSYMSQCRRCGTWNHSIPVLYTCTPVGHRCGR